MDDVICIVTDELIARMALWLHQKVDPELEHYQLKPLTENKEHVIRRENIERKE